MFQNRKEAGKLLSRKLSEYKASRDSIVLAIPRGGVVVGKQIATELSLPLSLIVVKKLGAPNNPELAIGAVAPNGIRYIDWDLSLRSGVEQDYLDKEITLKKREVEERVRKFLKRSNLRGGSTSLKDKKLIILVDDGVATGATVMAAIKYIGEVLSIRYKVLGNKQVYRGLKPRNYNLKPHIILAVPVIAKETCNRLQSEVDKIVAMEIPESFQAVGQFYREFPQVSDEEVIRMLES